MKNYDYDDDYGTFQDGNDSRRLHTRGAKKKFKGKGHQSLHGKRFVIEEDVTIDDTTPINDQPLPRPRFTPPSPQPTPVTTAATPTPSSPQFAANPSTTHTIKGNIIDFSRVASIDKIDNPVNGRMTYGVKFLFLGKKGLFRVVWFNANIQERDRVYVEEYAFWKSVQQQQQQQNQASSPYQPPHRY